MRELKQKGQVVIILLLIIVVALAVGLTVTTRSLTEIKTSSKGERGTRSFSAAEAGLEKIIQQDPLSNLNPNPVAIPQTALGNESNYAATSTLLPKPNQALAYPFPPGVGKADFAHFWLADPANLNSYYADSNPTQRIVVYFGNPSDPDYTSADQAVIERSIPAIEVNLVTKVGTTYKANKGFYDPNAPRSIKNKFTDISRGCPNLVNAIVSTSNNDSGVNETFYCKENITIPSAEVPLLIRVRILYSDKKQKLAVGPPAGCDYNPAESPPKCSLPPQAKLYISTGTSGLNQKRLQVFSISNVVLPFFDFAIFSAGKIEKLR